MDQGTQRLIRRHNAQMRDLIVRDIDALEDKLNVKRQVSHLTDNAVDTVKGKLGMKNRNPNESWVDFLRHNAAPLAAVGLGGTVLAKNVQSRVAASSDTTTARASTHVETRYFDPAMTTEDTSSDGLKDKVGSRLSGLSDGASSGLGSAKDRVSDTGSMVTDKASTAKDAVAGHAMHAKDAVAERIPSRTEATQMARDHGQLLGVAALAAGAVAGAFVPRSKAEERRLAPVQSTVREKASDLAEQGVEKAKETADRASDALSMGVETVKDEFSDTESEPSSDDTSSTDIHDTTQPNRITGSRSGVTSGSTPGSF